MIESYTKQHDYVDPFAPRWKGGNRLMPTWPSGQASRLFQRRTVYLSIGVLAIVTLAALALITTSKFQPARSSTAPDTGNSPMIPIPAQDQRDLFEAEQILIGHCMRQAGFAYWPQPYVPQASSASEFPFLPPTIPMAEQYGYQSAADESPSVPDPNLSYFSSLSKDNAARYGVDLNGGAGAPRVQATNPQGIVISHSTDGCTAVAEGILYGNFTAWFRAYVVVENLSPLWRAKVQADPEYTQSTRAWSRCMLASGFEYATPQTAAERFRFGSETHPGILEKSTAITARKCADDVHMDSVVNHLVDHYEPSVYHTQAEEVDTYSRLESKAVSLAVSLVTSNQR
jgi:hypothetical protein